MVKNIVIASLLLLLSGVLGVGGGVGLSLLQSARQSKVLDTPEGRRFLATQNTMAHLMTLRMNFELCADTPDARKATLHTQLATIQSIKDNLANPDLLPLIEVQNGIAHGQLALVEDSSGNRQAYAEQMSAAGKAFKAAGWTDYSESNLRTILGNMQGSSKDQHKPGAL
jgi:hypothetical protein